MLQKMETIVTSMVSSTVKYCSIAVKPGDDVEAQIVEIETK
jgi:hypothetical protein